MASEKKNMFSFLITLSILASVAATHIPDQTAAYLGGAQFSLTNRYQNTYVNNVFADNILLTLAYMRGIVKNNQVDWNEIRQPFTYSFTLRPGEAFAFHQDALPEFTGKVVKTTNAHFGTQEGFKSDGYLVADGVCHLASLINEAAQNAGLKVVAPTNHNFAKIPEVDQRYGTAIYYMPGNTAANALQNLYVENSKNTIATFTFTYNEKQELQIKISKASIPSSVTP